jgi:hypothetical protein
MADHTDLHRWHSDGTMARVDQAREARTPVRIRRSSGEFVTGIICAWGHGGLSHVVAWGPGAEGVTVDSTADLVHFPPGVPGKRVDTADLLEFKRREHIYLVVERTELRGMRVLYQQHGDGTDFFDWSKPVETLSRVEHHVGTLCVVDMPT